MVIVLYISHCIILVRPCSSVLIFCYIFLSFLKFDVWSSIVTLPCWLLMEKENENIASVNLFFILISKDFFLVE